MRTMSVLGKGVLIQVRNEIQIISTYAHTFSHTKLLAFSSMHSCMDTMHLILSIAPMNDGKMSENEQKSTQLAGFAPASRRGTKSPAAGGGGGAQSSSSSTAPPSAASQEDGNVVDTGNRITKKKAAATNPSSSSSAATSTTTKKRSKSSSSSKSSSFGAAATGGSGSMDDNSNNNYNEATTIQPIDPSTMNSTSFQPMSLSQIQLRIKSLLDELPSTLPEVPPDYINPDDESNIHSTINQNNSLLYPSIKSFASSLQTTIEKYNLLLSLISSATYQWGVDRSGASQQNLSVMNSELQQCQEVITSVISGRLSNVLCPAVDVLVGRVEIVKAATSSDCENDGEYGGVEVTGSTCTKKRKLDATDRLIDTATTTTTNNEQRINHYTRPLVDPSYVHLCHQIVARNGEMLRYTLATCIHTAQRVIGDYLKAMKKDVGHEVSKGGYY